MIKRGPSLRPTREREKRMRRFKSVQQGPEVRGGARYHRLPFPHDATCSLPLLTDDSALVDFGFGTK